MINRENHEELAKAAMKSFSLNLRHSPVDVKESNFAGVIISMHAILLDIRDLLIEQKEAKAAEAIDAGGREM